MDNEVWKDIFGFEGLYQVSSYGRVKRISTGNGRTFPGKILKSTPDTWGYQKLLLSKSGKNYARRIHRLVALAFHENPANKPAVNHKDRIKSNNHVDNLEWATTLENNRHAHETGFKINPKTNGSIRRKKIIDKAARSYSQSTNAISLGGSPSSRQV